MTGVIRNNGVSHSRFSLYVEREAVGLFLYRNVHKIDFLICFFFPHSKFHSRQQFFKGNEHVMYVSDGIIVYDKYIVNLLEIF